MESISRRALLMSGAFAAAARVLPASTSEAALKMRSPRGGPQDRAWADIRSQFITARGVDFLNNASLGMPPGVVSETVARGYAALSADPIAAKHELTDHIAGVVRPALSDFVGAGADEISLTRNATEALHLSATGLALEPGDEVLVTSQEHPAGRRPWDWLAAHRGIQLTEVFVPSPLVSVADTVDRLTSRITDRTRAMAFCHVTRGGHLYPVAELAAAARGRGVATMVDGAQALGMFPIGLHELGCDVYSASLHKWVLAPMGTGMLYVRRGFRGRMRSAFEPQGMPSTRENPAGVDLADPRYEPSGTADLPVRAGIGAAVEFARAIGIEAIGVRNRWLSDTLKTALAELPECTLLSGTRTDTSCPGSTIFEVAGVDPVAAVAALATEGIHIDEHVRDGHNAMRISTHYYNTEQQIARVVRALGVLARS